MTDSEQQPTTDTATGSIPPQTASTTPSPQKSWLKAIGLTILPVVFAILLVTLGCVLSWMIIQMVRICDFVFHPATPWTGFGVRFYFVPLLAALIIVVLIMVIAIIARYFLIQVARIASATMQHRTNTRGTRPIRRFLVFYIGFVLLACSITAVAVGIYGLFNLGLGKLQNLNTYWDFFAIGDFLSHWGLFLACAALLWSGLIITVAILFAPLLRLTSAQSVISKDESWSQWLKNDWPNAPLNTHIASIHRYFFGSSSADTDTKSIHAPLFRAILFWTVTALLLFTALGSLWSGRFIWAPMTVNGTLPNNLTILDIVKVALTTIGGLGAISYVVLKYKEGKEGIRANDLADAKLRQDHEQAEMKRIDDQLQTAINQLGHDKAAVRIAGVNALVDIADHYAGYRQRVVDILCGYLRSDRSDYKDDTGIQNDKAVESTIFATMREHLQKPENVENSVMRKRLWNDYTFDFHGMHVTEDVDLSNIELRHRVDFHEAYFHNEFQCKTTLFLEVADFTKTIFENDAVFFNTIFNKEALFTKSRFKRPALLTGTTFVGIADFDEVQFEDFATFGMGYPLSAEVCSSSLFLNHASFQNAQFVKSAYFAQVVFDEYADFNHATFISNTTFRDAHFNGNFFNRSVNFADTVFNSEVVFSEIKVRGSACFIGAIFKDHVTFEKALFQGFTAPAQVSNELHDLFCEQGKETEFSNAVFKKSATFDDAFFSQDVYFDTVEMHSFSLLTFRYASQAFIELKNCFYTRAIGR
ncbi:hypothetical protein CS006_05765 [Bifidobacterium primatium]|uniref:Pentapeptide repeat-containing protein n=1 Tax=Bifidobacterium primatium TaxID=2045438 RepID=A0A2M9H9P1_9BIFI|nr:pentapeptide repeat-containing protein [Bifidobacterium primatium]PJM73533.1 hypothetical protein CS006_05765 [Bifidobacterium primatium]